MQRMERKFSKDEKLERVKTALKAIGEIDSDDDMEMAVMKTICHSLTAYRLWLSEQKP